MSLELNLTLVSAAQNTQKNFVVPLQLFLWWKACYLPRSQEHQSHNKYTWATNLSSPQRLFFKPASSDCYFRQGGCVFTHVYLLVCWQDCTNTCCRDISMKLGWRMGSRPRTHPTNFWCGSRYREHFVHFLFTRLVFQHSRLSLKK